MTSSVSNKVYKASAEAEYESESESESEAEAESEADYIYRCAVIKFFHDKRGEVRSANPDLRASDITEKLCHMWECMSEEDREKYTSLVKIKYEAEAEAESDEIYTIDW